MNKAFHNQLKKTNKSDDAGFPIVVEDKDKFESIIKAYREKYIRKATIVVDEIFSEIDFSQTLLKHKQISETIQQVRQMAYERFLIEEYLLNRMVMSNLHKQLDTPRNIIDKLMERDIYESKGSVSKEKLSTLCGEYAGCVYPYIYQLALSNTNSRRSRAGKTFEAIIYKLYDIFGYPFDSQSKLGRKKFEEVGLGKKVDSVLPNVAAFNQRRGRTIIGTMKTSLRERWQEVAEEIERTNIPEIHLLTVDLDIAKSKAQEMAQHNIILVGLKELLENKDFSGIKNMALD